MSSQRNPLRQVTGLAVVVLVMLGIVYSIFSHQYGKATFTERFNFNKQKVVKPGDNVDLKALLANTPQQMALGKQVFQANCVPCHGAEGYGNGPRSAGIIPPPRNFHQPKFHYGTSVLTLYHTVSNGSPGTSMPSFAALSPQERMAVVHYVRHWIPADAKQPNSAADLAELDEGSHSSGPTPVAKLQPVPTGPRIPIVDAMKLVAQDATQQQSAAAAPTKVPAPKTAPDLAQGQHLYQTYCQKCHGADGNGGFPIRMVDSDPYLEVTAHSFQHPIMLSSMADAQGFDQLVLHGLPGRMMPGFGILTSPELNSLYAYVQKLAGGGK